MLRPIMTRRHDRQQSSLAQISTSLDRRCRSRGASVAGGDEDVLRRRRGCFRSCVWLRRGCRLPVPAVACSLLEPRAMSRARVRASSSRPRRGNRCGQLADPIRPAAFNRGAARNDVEAVSSRPASALAGQRQAGAMRTDSPDPAGRSRGSHRRAAPRRRRADRRDLSKCGSESPWRPLAGTACTSLSATPTPASILSG